MRLSIATAARRSVGGGRRGQPGRAGGAAVELALLAPFMIAVMLGMFEIGRGLMVKQTLSSAARKGCRTGILHQYGNSDITADVTNILRDAGFDATKFNPPSVGAITITVTDPNGKTLAESLDAPEGSTVSVQVTIPVSSIKWVSTVFLTGTMVESDAVVMMKQ